MKKIGRLLGAMVVLALTLALASCATYVPNSYDPPPLPGDRCVPGQTVQAACSTAQPCPAGQTPGYACTSNGVFSACQCVVAAGDAAVPQDGATVVCQESATRSSSCRTCPTGQTAHETCRSNAWTACECVMDQGGGQICAPNSVTTNSCANCATGYVAQQRCAADGRSYGPCQCVASGSTQACVPNSVRNACNPCTNGGTTALGTEVCNAAGTSYECRLNAGATCPSTGGCSNGATQSCPFSCPSGSVSGTQTCSNGVWGGCSASCLLVCSAGSSRNACNPCTSGTAAGTEVCNAAGTGYECRLNAGATCSGGSTGGGTCRSQAFTLIVRAANSSLRVRCWDMNGAAVTSTTNELRIGLPGGCGIAHCVDGTGEGSAFAESGYWSTSRSESATNRFDLVSVEGREDSLRNQQGQARICPDGGRSKLNVAVNTDQLGRCL